MDAEGGRVGAAFSERSTNRFQNAFQIAIDVAVPEAKDAETGTLELFVSRLVVRAMRIDIVLSAIYFDREAVLQTNEIDDVAAAGRLTAKMESLAAP